jgi:hypothetical protein
VRDPDGLFGKPAIAVIFVSAKERRDFRKGRSYQGLQLDCRKIDLERASNWSIKRNDIG